MEIALRLSYALGRALGKGAHEFMETMWPVEKESTVEQPPAAATDLGPYTMQEAYAGVDDETDWSSWARKRIAGALENAPDMPWMPQEWIDTVSGIVTEKLASDPATAIAALWNYELRRQETT